jgi:phosphatidylglycerol lysyltransferase
VDDGGVNLPVRDEQSAFDRERLLALLGRFGTCPESFFVLYGAPWRFYSDARSGGVVCFVETHRTAVGWCDPLCAPDETPALLAGFKDSARSRGLRPCLLALQEPAARIALSLGYAVRKIGEEPVFDLRSWHLPPGDPGKNLRWCLNHARGAGTTVSEYRRDEWRDPRLEAEIERVSCVWAESLGRRVVGSFLRPSPLEEVSLKRIFYASRGQGVEAFLACLPVYGRNGWYLEDLMRLPSAPNGTNELLIVEAMLRLARDGAPEAALGIAPLRGSEKQLDPGARWVAPALQFGFTHFDSRFHFASLSRFKAKFRPTTWEPRYVAYWPPRSTPRLVRAVLAVLDPDVTRT